MSFVDGIAFARKIDGYISDATSNGTGNDKFDSTTLMEWEVPGGKRWYLIGGYVKRDVSSTATVTVRSRTDKNVLKIGDESAATTGFTYPDASIIALPGYLPLDAGEYIDLTFGTAQGAGAYASCIILEVSV